MLTLVKKLIIKILNLKFVFLLQYKNINFFAKGYVPNLSEKDFVTNNLIELTYVISDLKGEGFIGTFYEKELQKTNQTV